MKVPRVESKLRVFAFRITFTSQVCIFSDLIDLYFPLGCISFSLKLILIYISFGLGQRPKRQPKYNKLCYYRGMLQNIIASYY